MGEAKTGLIDFLYKDLSRIESLFAQLFHGSLKEIAATESFGTSSSNTFKAGLHAVEGSKTSEKQKIDTLEKRIDPHDQKILDILKYLNLPQVSYNLPSNPIGQIFLIKGNINIRDYQTIKNAIPIILSSFTIPNSNKVKLSKKELNEQKKLVESLFKLVPMGLELEIKMEDNTTLIGFLKEQFLTESPNDLLKIYGNELPGQWYCLGIVDSIKQLKSATNVSNLRQSIDEFAIAIKEIYDQETIDYAITPILVFRDLTY